MSASPASLRPTAVGIDLGTTNSCIAVWLPNESRVKVIRVAGSKTTPSVVHFPSSDDAYATAVAGDNDNSDDKDAGNSESARAGRETLVGRSALGAPVVGRPALDQAERWPLTTIVGAKRFIGRDLEDEEVVDEQLRCAYDIVGTSHRMDALEVASKVRIQVQNRGKMYALLPEEISAFVLQYLRVGAEMYLQEHGGQGMATTAVKTAVITVPARFGYAQRLATRDAATRAGFTEVVLLAEPTAAALAYGLGVAGAKTFVVFDLGGGTFDVSVLRVNDGTFKVLAMGGDDRLGGNDVDDLLVRHVLREFCKRHGVGTRRMGAKWRQQPHHGPSEQPIGAFAERLSTVRQDITALCICLGIVDGRSSDVIVGLRQACERAKIDLCQSHSGAIGEQGAAAGGGGAAAAAAGAGRSSVGGVGVGCSSDAESSSVEISIKLPQSSACTALRNGSVEDVVRISMRDLAQVVEPLIRVCTKSVQDALVAASIAVPDVDEILLVGGATRMPPVRWALGALFKDRDICKDINPDEVVAEGAAVHAAILSGEASLSEMQDVLLMDVLPNAIGLEGADGAFVPILVRNSSVPARQSKVFRTAVDGQKGITVILYEGNDEVASQNEWMARFDFPIPKVRRGPAGKVAINVTFSISAGGMIRVETDVDSECAEEKYWEDLWRFSSLVLVAVLLFATLIALKMVPLAEEQTLRDGSGSSSTQQAFQERPEVGVNEL
jgi:molecular chaperone DnaK (HSP70)